MAQLGQRDWNMASWSGEVGWADVPGLDDEEKDGQGQVLKDAIGPEQADGLNTLGGDQGDQGRGLSEGGTTN